MSKSINISFYLEVGEFWVNEADSEFGVVYTQNNASSGFKNFQFNHARILHQKRTLQPSPP